MTQRAKNERISAIQLSNTSGIKRNTVDKYLLRLTKEGLATRVKSALGHYMYFASDNVLSWIKEGRVPRSPLKHMLDVASMDWEDRKGTVRMRAEVASLLRAGCKAPSTGDRAQQFTHKGEGFSVSISKNGVAVFRVQNVEGWTGSVRKWASSLGVCTTDIERVMSELEVSIPQGFGRIEVPVLAPGFRENNVRLEVVTTFDEKTVRSNINYSKNMVGWEISGPNWFLDRIASELATHQHKLASQYMASKKTDDKEPGYYG